MKQNEIQQMKQKLFEQRVELEELESSFKETSQPVELDQSKVGRLSRMDAMQGQQLALEAARRRKQQLINIEEALHRINTDEFGYCVECGEEIDRRRLAFNPANTLCIECAEKLQ